MTTIRFLSSDLNGTLVYPHTMQEVIRWGFPQDRARFERAAEAFGRQVEGRLDMAETFRIAGRETRGLTLRLAIEYAWRRMKFVEGFGAFTDHLRRRGIHFAVISTGYSVTLYVIRYGTSTPPFQMGCNRLLFADPHGRIIDEDELEGLVRNYLWEEKSRRSDRYDRILATGQVVLGIRNEDEKAALALQIAGSAGIGPREVAHMGDTMGDSGGILGVARKGGLGIAFNYNRALETFLKERGEAELRSGRIVMVDPKGPGSDLRHVLPFLG